MGINKKTGAIVLLLGLCGGLVLAGQPVALGRSPFERVSRVVAGRFVASDIDDILVEQEIGQVEMTKTADRTRTQLEFRRLALLRLSGTSLRSVWEGPAFTTAGTAPTDIAGTCWATGDIDGDRCEEVLLFSGDSCRVMSFDADSITTSAFGLNGAVVLAAACCDLDTNGLDEVATVEVSPLDSGQATKLLKTYRLDSGTFQPWGAYELGLNWGAEARVAVCGSARLEDYAGNLPVVAGVYASPRPSIYGVMYAAGPDSVAFTTLPFPWQEWFVKTRVLPADELSLFNVGDTLVAWGYFVPGSRPGGPSLSFAALQDGEWRLLPLLEDARRLSGPVCRFTKDSRPGWLELRDSVFFFYPGDIFRWR